jgi:hypothetical protein
VTKKSSAPDESHHTKSVVAALAHPLKQRAPLIAKLFEEDQVACVGVVWFMAILPEEHLSSIENDHWAST